MRTGSSALKRYWGSFWQPVRRLWVVSAYLFAVRNDVHLQRISRCYVHWLPLNLFSEPLRWFRDVLTTRQRYRHPQQRPYDVYVPHLAAAPFPEPEPHCQLLEANWESIYAEYCAVSEIEGPPPNQGHVRAGRWGTFDMIAMGHVDEARAVHCPVTMETVSALPVVDMVTFSSLAPGTELRPHYGTTNIKLRHQLCLQASTGAKIRVGPEWRSWQQGRCLVIDDSFEHEVMHHGDTRRVILMVDCWHPQLTEPERAFLLELYRLWG